MNFLQLKQNVCDAVQVPWLTQQSRAGQMVNAELGELCTMLKLSQPIITVTVTGGQGDYSLASGLGVTDAAQIRDVFYTPFGEAPGSPLERTSASRIDEARIVPSPYPMMYAVTGVDTLQLAPVPSGSGTLNVRYTQSGALLSSDYDVPYAVPSEYHDVIWLGAALQMATVRRPSFMQPLQQRYDRRLSDLRSWMSDLGGSKPMRMQRAGGTTPNRDPSIYPGY